MGTFIKANENKKQLVWIEETRSMQLNAEDKVQLLTNLGADQNKSPKLLYAYAIEFRIGEG